MSMPSKGLKVLFVGDVFASTGRRLLERFLDDVRQEHGIDFIVANAENAAGGRGVTPEIAKHFFSIGVDVLTTGNHVFDQKEVLPFLEEEPRLLRPANFSARTPGRGHGCFAINEGEGMVAVINLQGRVYMPPHGDCPFARADEILKDLPEGVPVVVDFHAEATSEKQAMACYLDGRVSALIGTHTHVQTADATVLPKGTAFITDSGMTGPKESVIGMRADRVVEKFLTGMPAKFEPASGPGIFCAVVIDIGQGGRANRIFTVRLEE